MPDVPSTPAAPAAAPAASENKGATPINTAIPNEPVPQKHKVKVDGEEREVSIEDLIRGYSTNEAGQKRLKEAAEKEKQIATERARIDSILKAAKAGDYDALKEAGLSEQEIEQLSIKYLSAKQQAQLEEERRKALDPEKRELEDLRKWRQEQEAREKAEAEKREQADVQQVRQHVEKNVIDTLEQLPESMRRSGFFANRVLEAWGYAMENSEAIEKAGIKVTPQWVAGKVLAEARELYQGVLKGAKDDELDLYIPQDVWGRRKAPAQAPQEHPALSSTPQVRETRAPPQKRKRMTEAEITRAAYTGKHRGK